MVEQAAWAAPTSSPTGSAPFQPNHSLGRAFCLVEDGFGPARPDPPPVHPTLDCDTNRLRGDFRLPLERDWEDVVILMNCVFLNASGFYCLPCIGDMNCDERLSPADVAVLLRVFFSYEPQEVIRCPGPPGGK